MIITGPDASIRWRWEPAFRPHEFQCAHCGELRIESEFLDRLTALRTEFDRPVMIASGYRCPTHNTRVSKTGPRGPHTTGRACDIATYGPDAFALLGLAVKHGFRGLGVAQAGAYVDRFLHVDDLAPADLAPRPRLWSY